MSGERGRSSSTPKRRSSTGGSSRKESSNGKKAMRRSLQHGQGQDQGKSAKKKSQPQERNGAAGGEKIIANPVAILLPPWVTSRSKKGGPIPIYSIAIHPDGKRFATGGYDFLVKIWSMESLLQYSDPKQERIQGKTHTLLCTLNNHNKAVNCVKWSPDGKKLASGSDDVSTIIWQCNSKTSGSFNAFTGANVESWSAKTILNGMTSEVMDLAWSPDSRQLASCHIDNTIVIWRAKDARKLRVLRGHKGWVTGICWDPRNRFIASQATDGTVIVWNVRDGEKEKRLDKPFESKDFGRVGGVRTDLMGQATFTRLSWSPDGKYLAACRGYLSNSRDFVSPLFVRGSWKHLLNYTGHNGPTTVARFCPKMLRHVRTGELVNALAIGGMDNQITVWCSSRSKTFLCVEHVFEQSVLDIAWTPDGSGILACSHDGSVAFIRFDLKAHMDVEVVDDESVAAMGNSNLLKDAEGNELVELPEIVKLRRNMRAKKVSQKKGRKRQRDASISAAADDNDEENDNEDDEKDEDEEADDDEAEEAEDASSRRWNMGPNKRRRLTMPPPRAPPASSSSSFVQQNQREVRTVSGKRRIVPVQAIGGTNGGSHDGSSIARASGHRLNGMSDSPLSKLLARRNVGARLDASAEDSNSNLIDRFVGHSTSVQRVRKSDWMKPASTRGNVRCKMPRGKNHLLSSSLSSSSSPGNGSIRAGDVEGKSGIEFYVQTHKARQSTQSSSPSSDSWELTLTHGSRHVWSRLVSSKVLALAANKSTIAAACKDNLLYLFSHAGRQIILPLLLRGPVNRMLLTPDNTLLVATCDETLAFYKVSATVAAKVDVLMTCSLAPLKYRHPQQGPCDIFLSHNQLPAVTFQDRSRYIFNPSSLTWALMPSNTDFWASEFSSLLGKDVETDEEKKKDDRDKLLTIPVTNSKHATIDHLENIVSSAVVSGNSKDFRHNLIAYVKHLAMCSVPPQIGCGESMGLHANPAYIRLDELVQDLLGPYDWAPGVECDWDPYFSIHIPKHKNDSTSCEDVKKEKGNDRGSNDGTGRTKILKRELLLELLPHIAMAPKLQSYTAVIQATLERATACTTMRNNGAPGLTKESLNVAEGTQSG
mmetsp:Transcript_9306/g.22904  ORF Transcript_9306/g.22904 Transcript_9306/m.22904 type:complete len:1104 (-) Transcript_9306:384-3695(-)|eukprot:CAMPEP_0114496200 /NCGR_PEP_ID=MMETSP0109-20121206/5638_1 /TAXON_ID=29199 /ORGANISM="Chlorarachnion reptans, Strain CCCM449" /LENGTH=1103 /DNA_ID=CAMNT_0001673447 /DNA_START=169 /DNA_END=3480 /DNA_ORIENTATION=+